MFKWLKSIFGRDPVRVEVILRVSEIHVFSHGSKEQASEGGFCSNRSGVQVEEERPFLRTIPKISDEEKITELSEKFKTVETIEFGKNNKTET